MTPPKIILKAVRQNDLDNGRPDSHIIANGYPVGRIHLTNQADKVLWYWALGSVWTSAENGIAMHGYAPTMEAARAMLRTSFDQWLEWILAIPPEHLGFRTIDEELRKIGARS